MPNRNEITRQFGLQTLLVMSKYLGFLENLHTDGAAGRTLRLNTTTCKESDPTMKDSSLA
ncbi:MAG: hypothetical protein ABW157_10155 [Candidatus Thiodiazotropha sp. LLP2]